jgi:thiol-disulfide isomerase/thioredoxin
MCFSSKDKLILTHNCIMPGLMPIYQQPVFFLSMIRFLFLPIFILISAFSIGQTSKVIKWPEMEKLLSDPSDSLTIINFWATWCKPCVQEIPYFESARKQFKDKPVRFWFISLDFADQQKSKLDPFVKKRMPGSRVFLLDETNYDLWINKIDPGWDGAIPVTLFVNNSKKIRKFAGSELTESQLIQLISSNL